MERIIPSMNNTHTLLLVCIYSFVVVDCLRGKAEPPRSEGDDNLLPVLFVKNLSRRE
jgi:hypothetical protein